MKKILIKNAYILSPADNISDHLDMLILGDKIKEVKKDISDESVDMTINAENHILMPPFIEVPCFAFDCQKKSRLLSQIRSAIAGGFLNFAIPSSHSIDSELKKNNLDEDLKTYPLLEFSKVHMLKEGIDYFGLIEDFEFYKKALAYDKIQISYFAKENDIPLFVASKENSLYRPSNINEGKLSFNLGFLGIDPLCEILSMLSYLTIAERVKNSVHFFEISQAESFDHLKKSFLFSEKSNASLASYHLFFEEKDLLDSSYNQTSLKVYPPLLSSSHFILDKLKENLFSFIRSGDQPVLDEKKDLPFELSSVGMTNFETHFMMIYQKLIKNKVLDLNNLAKLLFINPYQFLNLNPPSLKKGSLASFILFDPEYKMNVSSLSSQYKNTPFKKQSWNGAVVYTFSQGKILFNRYKNYFY